MLGQSRRRHHPPLDLTGEPMSFTKIAAIVCVALTAVAVAASAGARSAPRLNGAAVAKAISRHDKVLSDAQGYVKEITGYAVQVCKAESKEPDDSEGKWRVTNALADRLDRAIPKFQKYNEQLKSLTQLAIATTLNGDSAADRSAIRSDVHDAIIRLKDATLTHDAEFENAWPKIVTIIRKHYCSSFSNAVKNAAHVAENSWADEHAGLYLLDRATRRAEGRRAPDRGGRGIKSGDPY